MLVEQIADKFVVGDGCWDWTAARNDRGYGVVRSKGRNVRAHRVVYELLVGPIPEDLELDHLCRRPSCVRPDHLEAVTHAENNRRGDHRTNNANLTKTHCPQGHEYDEVNTYVSKRGQRHCRRCHANRQRARVTREGIV